MANKRIPELSALDTISSNLSSTFFIVYDEDTNTTRKAALSQIDEAIEREISSAVESAIVLEPLSGLTITRNYNIPNNYRGKSVGVVTIDSNVTVTVSPTAQWVIDN